MRMDRLEVNFYSLRVSILSIIGPKHLLLWKCRNRFRFEADSDFGANSDAGADFDSGTDSEADSDFGTNSTAESSSGPTIWNRFQKTLELAGIDSNEILIFVISSSN